MKSKLFLIALICTLILGAMRAEAQATEISPSHLHAAENYLIATGVDSKLNDVVSTIVKAFSANMSANNREAFTGVMYKFMHKYYTWDNLKPALSKMYAEEFSEDELNQLTAFFNTPVGKKYGEKSVVLLQKSMLVGQQLVADHRPELEQMFKDIPPPTVK